MPELKRKSLNKSFENKEEGPSMFWGPCAGCGASQVYLGKNIYINRGGPYNKQLNDGIGGGTNDVEQCECRTVLQHVFAVTSIMLVEH